MKRKFEHLYGKKINSIYIITGEGFNNAVFLVSILFVIENNSGFSIEFDFYNPTISIDYENIEDFKHGKGLEYAETKVQELKNNKLNKAVGQQIKSITATQLENTKAYGENFIIVNSTYLDLRIELEYNFIEIAPDKYGTEIKFI